VKKSVSIVYEYAVENWSEAANGTVQKEQTLEKPFGTYSKPLFRNWGACRKFMCDFVHFSGKEKPWLKRPPRDQPLEKIIRDGRGDGPALWWHQLRRIDKDLDLGIDFDNWDTENQRPCKYAFCRILFSRLQGEGIPHGALS
jgi:hypothetical protein